MAVRKDAQYWEVQSCDGCVYGMWHWVQEVKKEQRKIEIETQGKFSSIFVCCVFRELVQVLL